MLAGLKGPLRCECFLLTIALLLAEASQPYLYTMRNDQIRDICILHSAQNQCARNLACYSTL